LIIAGVVVGVALVAASSGSVLADQGSGGGGDVTVSKTNDANHSGVFATVETVPASATFPWTVPYRVTISGGSSYGSHPGSTKIISITDSNTSNIGTCQALVGTTISPAQTEVCNYSVTLTAPQSSSLVNTVTLVYDDGDSHGHDYDTVRHGGGGYDYSDRDVTTSSSTVIFAPVCPLDTRDAKTAGGNDGGSCCPSDTGDTQTADGDGDDFCCPDHQHGADARAAGADRGFCCPPGTRLTDGADARAAGDGNGGLCCPPGTDNRVYCLPLPKRRTIRMAVTDATLARRPL